METISKRQCITKPQSAESFQLPLMQLALDQIVEPVLILENREEYYTNSSFRKIFGSAHFVSTNEYSFECLFGISSMCLKSKLPIEEEVKLSTIDGKIATVYVRATPFDSSKVCFIFRQVSIQEPNVAPTLDTKSIEVEFLREFFDNASLLMGVAEVVGDYQDLKFTLVNPMFAEYFGSRRDIPAEKVEGQLASKLMDENELGIVLTRAKYCDTACKFEFFPSHRNPAHCLLVNVIKGRSTSFSFIAQDVTRYKEMEMNYNDMKEKSDMDRRFLAIMSHEIRTCLSAIFAALSEIGNPNAASNSAELIQMGKDSGEQLRVVINDILDFAKIEENKLTLEKKEFPLFETLDGLLEAVSSEASQKKVEILCYVDDNVPCWVIGDRIRLRQVLLNLLSNAVKFSNENGEVEMEIALDKNKENYLHFSIRDYGIGIDAEARSTLFLPFAQAKVSTARKFGGSGLGLMICKKLVEMMEGTIEVVSEGSNKGSEFSFSVKMPSATSESIKNSCSMFDGEGKQVLIFTCSHKLGKFISSVLDKWNYSCKIADTREEAKQILQSNTAELALIDETLLATLLELNTKSEIISLGYTTKMKHDVKYLRKPVRKKNLLRILMEIFHHTPQELTVEKDLPSTPPLYRDLHMLIVDDNLCNCKVLQFMLSKLHLHNVDIVSDGVPAVDAVKRKKYDIVFMDMMMPGMAGTEATRIIKKDVPKEMQPIIIGITANAFESERKEFSEAGADAVLTKPLDQQTIAETLKEFDLACESQDKVKLVS